MKAFFKACLSWWLLVDAAILGAGVGALYWQPALAGGLLVGLIDLYFAVALAYVAWISDREKATPPPAIPVEDWFHPFLPSRLQAVFFVLAVLAGQVLAFAAIYHALAPGSFTAPFKGHWSEVYFSMVTAATLGYGDIAPASVAARQLVMLQLASGMLLLIGVFPLVVARISNFNSK